MSESSYQSVPVATLKHLTECMAGGFSVWWHPDDQWLETPSCINEIGVPLTVLEIREPKPKDGKAQPGAVVVVRAQSARGSKHFRHIWPDGTHIHEGTPAFTYCVMSELLDKQSPLNSSTKRGISGQQNNDNSSKKGSSTMDTNKIMSALKDIGNIGFICSKNVAASEFGARFLAAQVRKHLGSSYPAVLTNLPYYKDVEPLLLSCLVYIVCRHIGGSNATVTRLKAVAQKAIYGEFHELARPLMSRGRGLLEDLLSSPEIQSMLNSDDEPVE